jgi:N-glycosidase YbiA
MFTQYGVPVYSPSVNPIFPGMSTFGYHPMVNKTTAKIVNNSLQNSFSPYAMTVGAFAQPVRPVLNEFYAKAMFPNSKPSSSGLDLNMYPSAPFSNNLLYNSVNPNYFPHNGMMVNNLFMKKCACKECKRVAFFGSAHCCKLCQISYGNAHTDKCNLRYNQPSYESDVIKFGNVGEPYFEFANGYDVPITIGTIRYNSSEHYFQSRKFTSPSAHIVNIQQQILSATTPKDAYDIAIANATNVDSDWNTRRNNVMVDALKAKFQQHPDLRDMLKETKNSRIIYHVSSDNYWGDFGDGTGENKLGKLLMTLRTELSTPSVTGGSSVDVKQKYLQYKNKYLELKKRL